MRKPHRSGIVPVRNGSSRTESSDRVARNSSATARVNTSPTWLTVAVLVAGMATKSVAQPCDAPIVEPVGGRYLRIGPQPTTSGKTQAIFVTPDCTGGVGGKYVGVPSAIDIDGDSISDEMVAGLVDDPLNAHFLTPAQWGELYVYGQDIVPETSYIVQGDCGSPGNPSLFAGTGATTWDWGDTNNDGVDFLDISNVVSAFTGNFSQATLAGTDLTDCVPDQIIDFDDIVAAVKAFTGRSYAESTCCARPCPDVPACSGDPSCDDGVFCNGPESCIAGQCRCGPDPCPGELCNEGPDTCSGSQVQMALALRGPTLVPGQRVNLEIRVQNLGDLKGYQTTLAITPLSPGAGAEGLGDVGLSVLCPDGVAIETERTDYVFTNVENQKAEDCVGLRAGAVVIEAAGVDIGAALAYLVTYTLDVSPNAELGSTYEISLVPDPESSFLLDSTGRRIPFSSGEPAIVTISANRVPTVSVWGIVLMSLLVLTAATLVLANRRVRPV